jgi:hypothetical protein
VRQRRVRQIDLFEMIDPPRAIPPAIEQEALDLLTQLLLAMVPIVEAEVGNEDLD